MNTDRTRLEARAARYAALADPVRLRIVDLLTLGDAAPVEVQRELGISSALLAHHLRVLDRAGFLIRSRSEADRRRTYLRLAPGALDDLIPTPTLAARRVVFVCTGNSARSQLAAALWREASPIPGASAGTHPAERVDPGAVAAARRHGLELEDATPRHLDEVASADDIVVTVCDRAHEELDGEDRLHWSVADPVADGSETAFDEAYEQLAARIDALATRMTGPNGSTRPHPIE